MVQLVSPMVDCGRFPAKRTLGSQVEVVADVFVDGHDRAAAVLRYRHADDKRWSEAPMVSLGNDRWSGSFPAERLGGYRFAVRGWVDRFQTWRDQMEKRLTAGQDVSVELEVGARIIDDAGRDAAGWAARLRDADTVAAGRAALDPELEALAAGLDPRPFATDSPVEGSVLVEPPLAGCSAWYELFPRSLGKAGAHGTLKDVAGQLLRIQKMGFDVVYLPPIHPIGVSGRKGRNNTTAAKPGDVGSPWAIGAKEGGHTAVLPDLGTISDVADLAEGCRRRGMHLALDLAFQCSPDHPWVTEHPSWFRHLPDGSIRYAENPPKLYQDIYPLDFETEDWRDLWNGCLEVVRFWVRQGVTVFRVDNPHTKPFAFWEWLIEKARRHHPELIFLAEAFTRPRVMERLAKLGFSQSYTYFTWRQSKHDLTRYVGELNDTPMRDYFRPNFWPNTPDILTEQLQEGGRPAFISRLVLAATLSPNYGVYGPAFELIEQRPARPGSEEYLDSEKYQLRKWKLADKQSLEPLMTTINTARREHPALAEHGTTTFCAIENDQLIGYLRRSADGADVILTVVNLDPDHVQAGWIEVPIWDLGLADQAPYQVQDLLSGEAYVWHGAHNYVELDPAVMPAHVFHLRRGQGDPHDFEYAG